MAGLRKRKAPSDDATDAPAPAPEPAKRAPRKKAEPKTTEAGAEEEAVPEKQTNGKAVKTAPKRAAAAKKDDDASQDTSGVSQDSTITVADAVEDAPPKAKKARVTKAKPKKALPVINNLPTEKLHVYTFGKGDNSELGQGPSAKQIMRPRLMQSLLPSGPGVVQIAAGSMHGAVLTWKGEVMTWGVNDLMSLGRKTSQKDPTKTIDGNDDDDDTLLNELECQPVKVEGMSEYKIAKVACCDNSTWCITDTGLVIGWGTFRDSEGRCLFRKGVRIQETPFLIPELKNIVDISCASNCAYALDGTGTVWGWGVGTAMELGRRVVERNMDSTRIPTPMPLPKKSFVSIGSGMANGFAIHKDGRVYAWGPNNWAQTGIYDQNDKNAPEPLAKPTVVKSLSDKQIVEVHAGQNHALFLDDKGQLYAVGRADFGQLAVDPAQLTIHNAVYDSADRLRMVTSPVPCASKLKLKNFDSGIDHNIAITTEGKPYAWGYSAMHAVGLGPMKDTDAIEVPTAIENTATRDVVMRQTACGAHFSCLAGVARSSAPVSNGSFGGSQSQSQSK